LQEALAGVNLPVPKFVALNVLAAERFARARLRQAPSKPMLRPGPG
jgi:hypothetical protein